MRSEEKRHSRKIQSILNTVINNCKIIEAFYLDATKRKRLFVVCECQKCHNNFKIRYDTLNHLQGDHCPQCNIKARGQLQKTPHHKLFYVWWGMKTRCYNKNNKRYKDYGARGITVCDEWLSDFEIFYTWAINSGYGRGLSIDRINNNRGYSPDNCRWVDHSTQQYNTRRNFLLWYNNKWKTTKEIAQSENISERSAYYKYVQCKKTRLPRKQLYNIDNIKK